MNTVATPTDRLLAAFAATALVHIGLNIADVSPWDTITKCLLAPLLVVWVLRAGGPRIIALALFFCFLGDLFLEFEATFLPGMVAFAAAHVCFISWFVSRGAVERIKRNPLALGILGIAAVVLIAFAWGGLEPAMRAPVVIYALLLTTTAVTALATGRFAGIGALLFLVSDAVIALGIAERIDSDGLLSKLTIMPLYAAAIAVLAVATTRQAPTREVSAR
jgi:hypothetical protein